MPPYGSRLARKPKHCSCEFRLKHGGLPDSMFDPKQLAVGVKTEMEHTDDASLAKQIAKAHLVEHPKYYKYLAKLEKQMKTNWVRRHVKQKLTPQMPWTMRIY